MQKKEVAIMSERTLAFKPRVRADSSEKENIQSHAALSGLTPAFSPEKFIKISDAILFALEKAADGYLAMDHFAKSGTSVIYGYEPPKSNLRMALHRLNKRGYIEKYINEERLVVRLTDAGREWVLEHNHDNSNWDGVWRIVIFDIPESHKRARQALRNKLKGWGFEIWQRSVWATKKPLTKKIRSLVHELKIESWVMVIESTNTGKA